jgi:Penicillin-binding protein 5, C-terminal domain
VALRRGDPAGTVGVSGIAVPVLAGADFRFLVPIGGSDGVDRTIRPSPGLRLPLAGGTRVGSLEFSVEGRPVGRIPVVAATSVGESRAGSGSGFVDPLASLAVVYRVLVLLIRAFLNAFL